MTYKHNFISLGHSTELLGILFTRYLYKAIDVKKGNSRPNTGFKRGFDSTDHQKLLVKLQNLSVSKLPFPWSQSYLTDKNNASESTAYSSLDQAWRSTGFYPSDPSVQPLQVFYIKDLLSVCNTFTVLDDSMHYAFNFKINMLMEDLTNYDWI